MIFLIANSKCCAGCLLLTWDAIVLDGVGSRTLKYTLVVCDSSLLTYSYTYIKSFHIIVFFIYTYVFFICLFHCETVTPTQYSIIIIAAYAIVIYKNA